MREEIEKLRSQQSIVEVPVKSEAAQDEINTLREKLRETEGLLEQLTKSWQEKLRQATKCKAEEAQHLEVIRVYCMLVTLSSCSVNVLLLLESGNSNSNK